MLPNIESTTTGVGSVMPARRPENDRNIEAYKNAPTAEKALPGRSARLEKAAAEREAAAVAKAKDKARTEIPEAKDKADINFQLSVEERDAFQAAFSNNQDPKELSTEERETLKKASERISKFIDEAIARNADNRERVEKAVGEWYNRITKGDVRGPVDLVNLLRQAAMGNLDDIGA